MDTLHLLLRLLTVTSVLNASLGFPTPLRPRQGAEFLSYQVSSVKTYQDMSMTAIMVTITDPTPAGGDVTRHCSTWQTAGYGSVATPFSTTTTRCTFANGTEDASFVFNVTDFADASDFAFEASHTYQDPAIGPCEVLPDGAVVFCDVTTKDQFSIAADQMQCDFAGVPAEPGFDEYWWLKPGIVLIPTTEQAIA